MNSPSDVDARHPSVYSSIRWTSLAQGIVAASQLATGVVLFKLLPVEVFGIVAMAHVVTGFADQLRELGTRMALVQRKEITPEVLDSAFVVNLGVGLVLGAGVWLAAPWAAAFYRSEGLHAPLQALSAMFVIASLGQVGRALLTRGMQFGRLAAIDVTAVLVEASVTITLAAAGYGVWSFIFGELAMTLAATVGVWIARPWWPGLRVRRDEVRSLVGFGANLMGFNVANYFLTNADRLIIGRVLGAEALGLYAFAQRLTLFPMRSLSGVLVNVLVPRFAREQDDLHSFAAHFVRACVGIALLSFPVLAALAVLIDPLVALYAPKWAPAAVLVALLCPAGMIQSLTRTVGPVFVARGRPDLLFRVGMLAGVVALCGSLLGVYFGVIGVALAFVVTTALTAIPTFWLTLSQISASPRLLVRALEPVLSATIVTTLVMAGLRGVLGLGDEPSWARLGVVALLGAASYWGFVVLRRPPALDDLRRVAGVREAARSEPSAN
ncbi:lipopolysaccharide biosynthesis protein [Myxococcota bacterium]|nr:lipopolysaccharide biosynthesis protein [Myxococcota bacterium]